MERGGCLQCEGPLESRVMVTYPPAAAPSGFNLGLADVACIFKRWAITGYEESQLRRVDVEKKSGTGLWVKKKKKNPATDSWSHLKTDP